MYGHVPLHGHGHAHGRHLRLPVEAPSRVQRRQASRHQVSATANSQLQLLRPPKESTDPSAPCLVYIPGADGTGNALAPQLPRLEQAGYDVRIIYTPADNRSSWQVLETQALELIQNINSRLGRHKKVTLVAESFGGCLGVRVARAAPHLLERLVLINPATSFNRSLGGLTALITATNLLSLFPERLYQVAQAVLMPLLVNRNNVGPAGQQAIKQMMVMGKPLATPDGPHDPASSLQDGRSPGARFRPSDTASWRMRLLTSGNLPDEQLRRIRVPTLLVASAGDRLLPSLTESARLQRLIPQARRLVLPESGHTALLEASINLADILAEYPASPLLDASEAAPFMGERTAHEPTSCPLPGGGQGGPELLVPASSAASLPMAQASAAAPASASAQAADASRQAGLGPSSVEARRPQAQAPGGSLSPQQGGGAGLQAQNGVSKSQTAVLERSPGPGPSGGTEHGQNSHGGQNGHTGQRGKQARRLACWAAMDDNFESASQALSIVRSLISPVVDGVENLPASEVDRPLLFVGNHSRLGLYDLPWIMSELYVRGIKVRGLAHKGHWASPLGGFFERFGAVKANPLAAFKLLRDGQAVLLFPGGASEVNKKQGAEYQLQWRESPDFVRMAAKTNALIVPFACVGADDAFDIFMDADQVLSSPLLGPLARTGLSAVAPDVSPEEATWPITRLPFLGLPSLIPVPRLERLYLRFLEPLDAKQALGELDNSEAALQSYATVQERVTQGLAELLAERSVDPLRPIGARWQQFLRSSIPSLELLGEASNN